MHRKNSKMQDAHIGKAGAVKNYDEMEKEGHRKNSDPYKRFREKPYYMGHGKEKQNV